MFPYTLLTTDIADHRSREIGRTSSITALWRSPRAVDRHTGRSSAGRPPRRSRSSASARQCVVRRLDECVADDLGRTLAPTE